MRTPCNGDFFTPIIVNRGGQIDASSLDPLKMRTPCNGDFFTPIIVNREGGQIDARC
ncbi:MAG TPA: hypothetical protein VLA48_07450 [Nitrososphaeraceae archaeon]|nr:hypothetical protein [Nitrososphaeraceae archaeon]